MIAIISRIKNCKKRFLVCGASLAPCPFGPRPLYRPAFFGEPRIPNKTCRSPFGPQDATAIGGVNRWWTCTNHDESNISKPLYFTVFSCGLAFSIAPSIRKFERPKTKKMFIIILGRNVDIIQIFCRGRFSRPSRPLDRASTNKSRRLILIIILS